MIRLKKSPFTQKIKLIFEKSPPFFSKELLLGLFLALTFHGIMTFLFSIDTPESSESKILSPIKVKLDFIKAPLGVKIEEPKEPFFATPPGIEIPFKLALSSDPVDYINVSPNPKPLSKNVAYIKGPFSQTLSPPPFSSSHKEDRVKISFRSDENGDIFWVEWVEKPKDLSLMAPLEKWILSLKVNKAAKFSVQALEVYFRYD
ncbi:MAG: hypothetical protein KDK62_03265 [Chlamydiia bacterium]|nr:hypothetical protein [Chlamydiia bacterium]